MSDRANLWEAPIGADSKLKVTAYKATNQPLVCAGTETLTIQCWQGDNLSPVEDLVSATWTGGDPANGVGVLILDGSATADLTPDFYLLRWLITLTSGTYTAWEGWLSLKDAPGDADPPATYCSLQDMIDLGGDWLAGHMMASGRTSFLAERARARYEMDKVILAHVRPGQMTSENMVRAGAGIWAPDQPNTFIKGLLDDDKLLVSQDIKSATAYLAITLVCERALTWGEDDPFAKRAAYFRSRWRHTVATTVAQIDTDADGVGDYIFHLGYFSFR